MPRLTIKEAAQALGVSPDTIKRRIKAKELSAQKGNRGQWLVDVPDARPSACPSAPPMATTVHAPQDEWNILEQIRQAHAAEIDRLTAAHAAEVERLERIIARFQEPGILARLLQVFRGLPQKTENKAR